MKGTETDSLVVIRSPFHLNGFLIRGTWVIMQEMEVHCDALQIWSFMFLKCLSFGLPKVKLLLFHFLKHSFFSLLQKMHLPLVLHLISPYCQSLENHAKKGTAGIKFLLGNNSLMMMTTSDTFFLLSLKKGKIIENQAISYLFAENHSKWVFRRSLEG